MKTVSMESHSFGKSLLNPECLEVIARVYYVESDVISPCSVIWLL